MLSSTSSAFDSLPARPPTPPREIGTAVDDAISFLDDSNEVDRLLSKSKADDRPEVAASDITPSSSQDTSASGLRKVGFSPHPLYHKISGPGELSSPAAQLVKRSPSKDAKPLKSILKLSNAPPPTPDDLDSKFSNFSPDVPGSFGKMLHSVVQQLAGSSRAARRDAYLTLNGVLRAYSDIPDVPSMLQKMDLLMQFMTRDMAWKDTNGNPDTQIISQALHLATAILFKPELSERLDDDFKVFLIDRSIVVMEHAQTPKQIVKLHMWLLAQQHFHSSILSPGKVEKIITVLQTIEERFSGNSVVATRLMVYARLLQQSPSVMLARLRDWMEHVLHGMLSSIQEIRQRAVETGTCAGFQLGTQPYAAKSIQEMLDTEIEEGQTYYDYLNARLYQMIPDKELGPYVPQIWASIILFFRSKRKPLEKWHKLKSWLPIFQRCMNASDINVRYQATLAWNKFVFVIMPDTSTSQNVLRMLTTPVNRGLEKTGSDKFSKQVRHHSFDSYYNMLHYCLRPGLAYEALDAAWTNVVEPVLLSMAKASSKGRLEVCRIVNGLLRSSAGVWNVNAAFETAAIKPEDLPKLEPRWVRSRLSRVLVLLEPILKAGMCSSGETSTQVNETWCSLMQSIADAGSQEVKTTNDLKEAIAALVNVFRRLWSGFMIPSEGVDEQAWLGQYVSLIDAMVINLGPASFAEDILATTDANAIEVAPTPSHRPSKHHSAPQSPMVIMLGQFYHSPKEVAGDEAWHESLMALLDRFLSSKSTPRGKIELLNRSLNTWSNLHSIADPVITTQMWAAIAETANRTLRSDAQSNGEQDSQSLGHLMRNSLDIAIKGLDLREDVDASDILTLYDACLDTAKHGAGDGGIVLATMEPFAKAIITAAHSTPLESRVKLAAHILQRPVWPRNRQVIDQAKKTLWGIGLAPHKASLFDPFEHIYALISDLMTEIYNSIETSDSFSMSSAHEFTTSAMAFLGKAPVSLLGTSLRKLQNGFAIWIEDKARKTSGGPLISNLICTTWSSLLRLLQSLPSKDSVLVKALEPLLIAGFSSPHRAIVNETIVFWNDTFGKEQSLEYPAGLEAVLRARLTDTDIELPTFPESNEATVVASLPELFDSQTEPPQHRGISKASNDAGRTSGISASQPAKSLYFTSKESSAGPQTSVSSPLRRTQHSSDSSTPKARLRHNDSQIQFAPIDSSPIQAPDESQNLTEHQKEVKARQLQNAQLFPDLSSSPIAQSTALPRGVSKRLDFRAAPKQDNDGDDPGTPTGLPDVNGLVSDDIPSSPTPSSTKDASQSAVDLDDEQDDEALQDPPSSPPRVSDEVPGVREDRGDQHEAGLDDTTTGVTDFATEHDNAVEEDGEQRAEPATEEMISASEFPSDTPLPAEQLQMEVDAAQDGASKSREGSTEEPQGAVQSSQLDEGDNVRGGRSSINEERNAQNEVDAAEISRVENSFIEHPAQADETDVQSTSGSQQNRKSSRKRKRPSPEKRAAKKQKQQSPFKRIWSSFMGGSQQEDDEDIGEEIVVASSQRSSSPVTSQAAEAAASPPKSTAEAKEPTAAIKEEPGVMQPPPKRGRGRPRKSETPTLSQTEAEPTRSLKRKASTISTADNGSSRSQASTSHVQDAPAPAKARKEREGQDTRRTRSSQSSQTHYETDRVTRRKSPSVVIDVENDAREREQAGSGSTEVATPQPQQQDGADRAILTPRSILGRLKGALSDFRGMLLGPQEEREFDDVLFELRRETHEAGRRGRDAGM